MVRIKFKNGSYNDGMDSFNAALGSFSMFKDLVELKD
jgi:hypothetical protein|uniref:Uncharacterized protein n=1 Tax=virus sp. ctmTa7 TaxID=2828255 RepID=A0A8S5RC54_9VIRU|nr:MAG TPA: hypothetical protein [virus sp. ctmTa7]